MKDLFVCAVLVFSVSFSGFCSAQEGLSDLARADTAVSPTDVHRSLFEHVHDYGFMWWEDAIFKTSDFTFDIQNQSLRENQ